MNFNSLLSRTIAQGDEKESREDGPRITNLLGAIKGALGACSPSILKKVAENLHVVPVHRTHLSELCSVAEELERLAPNVLDANFLLALADCDAEHTELARLLGLSAKLGSDVAHARLLEEAKAGNLLAAAIAFEAGTLTEEFAERIAQQLVQLLEKERHESARGRFGAGYSVDRCLFLIGLSLSVPSVARWNEVLSYLGDSAVIADHKEASVYRIVRDLELLPEEHARLLPRHISGLQASRFFPANLLDFKAERRSAAGLAEFIRFGLGGRSNLDIEALVSSALTAKGGDRQIAWRVLEKLRPHGYDLLALQSLGDNDPSVRAAAARFVACRVEDTTDTPALRHAVERISVDGSVLIPRAFVARLNIHCPAWVKRMIGSMRAHPSASVRAATGKVLDT